MVRTHHPPCLHQTNKYIRLASRLFTEFVIAGNGKTNTKMNCSGEVESLMMENLALDMMDISF